MRALRGAKRIEGEIGETVARHVFRAFDHQLRWSRRDVRAEILSHGGPDCHEPDQQRETYEGQGPADNGEPRTF